MVIDAGFADVTALLAGVTVSHDPPEAVVGTASNERDPPPAFDICT